MASTLIGALRVTLGLNTAEFSQGATRAESRLAGLGTSIQNFGRMAGGIARSLAMLTGAGLMQLVSDAVTGFIRLKEAVGSWGEAFKLVWELIKSAGQSIMNVLRGVGLAAQAAWEQIKSMWEGSTARARAQELLRQSIEKMRGGVQDIGDAWRRLQGVMGDDTPKAMAKASKAIRTVHAAADDAAKKLKELRDAFTSLQDALFPDQAKWKQYQDNLKLIADAAAAGIQMEHSVQELQRAARQKMFDDMGIPKDGGLAIAQMVDPLAEKVAGLKDELAGSAAGINEMFTDMDEPFKRMAEFGKQISANLAQALVYGQNLGAALVNSIKAAVAEIMANKFARMLFGDGTALGGGGLIGGLFKSIGLDFGGARAAGGPVQAGRMYLVGEKGPELMVPGSAGRIIPNDSLTRADSGTVINIDARQTSDPAALQQAVTTAVAFARQYTDASLMGAMRTRLRVSGGAA